MVSFRKSPLRATWHHLSGTGHALTTIYRQEGPRALWKGVGATVVGVMPARAIYFSAYTRGKHWLAEWRGGEENGWVHLGAAGLAGMVTATATNPIWMVKTQMQLQSSAGSVVKYRSSVDCARQIFGTQGVRGLYKGLSASYIGIAESSLQWVLYERLKTEIALTRLPPSSAKSSSLSASQQQSLLTYLDVFCAAAASKLVAAALSYPHEVLRTRLREDSTKYRGIVQACGRIWVEEGPAAFYGGMTAHLLRVVPNSAILFFSYELICATYTRYVQHK